MLVLMFAFGEPALREPSGTIASIEGDSVSYRDDVNLSPRFATTKGPVTPVMRMRRQRDSWTQNLWRAAVSPCSSSIFSMGMCGVD